MDYETLLRSRRPRRAGLVDFCGLEWDEACLAPEREPAGGKDGQPLASSPAGLQDVRRALASLRTVAGELRDLLTEAEARAV